MFSIKPLLLTIFFFCFGCSTHLPLQTVNYIDPDSFAGEWYIISNIPYFAERNKVDSKTTYLKIGPNQYQDIFESRDGSFDQDMDKLVGKVKSLNKQNTQWQSTFYWVMRFKFEILEVDDNYQLMLLGHRSRDYGWVMARDKKVTDEDYAQAMQTFQDNGYDTSKFSKVPQFPDDLNKAGYQLVAN